MQIANPWSMPQITCLSLLMPDCLLKILKAELILASVTLVPSLHIFKRCPRRGSMRREVWQVLPNPLTMICVSVTR